MSRARSRLQLPEHGMSYWVDSTAGTAYPRSTNPVEADVAVVGAGIAGISTATFLAEEGHDVVLVEANEVARQTTGHTTAKVTVGHGLRYHTLLDLFGEEKARLYADANRTALNEMASRVREQDIDCDFTRASAYSYAPTDEQQGDVEAEVDAALRLGLDATYVTDVPAPVDVSAAIRYDEQAHFHPRKYLLALLDSFEANGGRVFEETRVRTLQSGSPHRLLTDGQQIEADDVVVATHFPFYRRPLYLPRMMPGQSHVITVDVDGEVPDNLYYSAGPSGQSFRPIPTDDGTKLLVEGWKHGTGIGGDTMERLRKVESFAADQFPATEITHRWTAQDFKSIDLVPYIGPITPFSDSVYVVTGFGAWGMTHGTVAGLLLTDLISGRENEWERLYDPNRLPPAKTVKRLPKAAPKRMRQLVTGRRSPDDRERPPDLNPGEGEVVTVDGETIGLYRTDDGGWQAVSGTCTFSGCTLKWNGAGESWDCPCDGSRYTIDGDVFDGPAQEDLEQRPVTVHQRERREQKV